MRESHRSDHKLQLAHPKFPSLTDQFSAQRSRLTGLTRYSSVLRSFGVGSEEVDNEMDPGYRPAYIKDGLDPCRDKRDRTPR